MAFTAQISKWRDIAASELARANIPLPAELILAVIKVESNGVPGAVNLKSGASGLMQVMPNTLEWFRNQTGVSISLDDLRSKSLEGARRQIRVGIWVLGQFWQSACKWIKSQTTDIPISELARFADAFYAAGPGRVKSMAAALPRNWGAWQKAYPKSNITRHAQNVWSIVSSEDPFWDLEQIGRWIETKNDLIASKNRTGLVIGILILLLASLFLKGKKDGSTKEKRDKKGRR